MKTTTTRLLLSLLLSSGAVFTNSSVLADVGGAAAAPVIRSGDYMVVSYRLAGFDPAQFGIRGSRTLARNLAETEITNLQQRAILTEHAMRVANHDARLATSLNPLLKRRAQKAALRVHQYASDLAKISIELERMELLKGAARGKALTALDIERIRLHHFKTLRSVSNASALNELASNATQKEASIFGAKVSSIDKFSSGAWGKAVEIQRRTRMRILGGAAVSMGIVAFVLYSDFETERTEEKLTTTEYLPN